MNRSMMKYTLLGTIALATTATRAQVAAPPTPAPAPAADAAPAPAPGAPATPGAAPVPLTPPQGTRADRAKLDYARAKAAAAAAQVDHAKVELDRAAKNIVWQVGGQTTFLGAATSAAPAAMREQLKLPRGVGLVVASVDAGSAAEKAGLKQHDVIEKLNDQWLINTEQLAALLHTMKAGDTISLSIVRQGERQALRATLAEKDLELQNTAGGGGGAAGALDFLPAPMAAGAPNAAGDVRIRTFDAPAGMAYAPVPVAGGRNVVFVRDVPGQQITNWADDDVRIAVERDGNKITNTTVTDAKTGKTLFTGIAPPANDPLFQARPDLPEKIKKATEAAERQPRRMVFAPGGGMGAAMTLRGGGGGGKVTRWQDDDHVFLIRMTGRQPGYLLALSKKDGRTVFDGPVATDDERKNLPGEISEKFGLILAQPDTAKEFGVTPGGATGNIGVGGGTGSSTGGGGGGGVKTGR